MIDTFRPRYRRYAGAIIPLGLVLGLAACNVTSGSLYEGIGFREARFAEISAMREYRACRDEALELDRQARQDGDTARYLTSAKLLEQCESDLGPEGQHIAKEERMRAYALSVQNYLKGGDVVKARENLGRFRQAFPENDLYYADGSSFIETMEVLLALSDPERSAEFPFSNINRDVRAELKRMAYWKHN